MTPTYTHKETLWALMQVEEIPQEWRDNLENFPVVEMFEETRIDYTHLRHCVHRASPGPDRSRIRSQTYPGIAEAMAQQWG